MSDIKGDSNETDALADPGHLFDQTNGMADGLQGESDGTAGADEQSAADQADRTADSPVGQQDAFADDHDVDDGNRRTS